MLNMQRSYFMKTKAHNNASLTYFAIACSAQGNELSCQGLAFFSIIDCLSFIHFSDSDSSKHFAHSYLTLYTHITALCPFRFHITPGTRCSQSQSFQNQEREGWYFTEKHTSSMLVCTTNNFIYHTYLYLNRQFRNKLNDWSKIVYVPMVQSERKHFLSQIYNPAFQLGTCGRVFVTAVSN